MIEQAPRSWGHQHDHLRILANLINLSSDGRSNAFGTVTLAAGAATTTLTDPRISIDSYIGFMPTTANAAAAKTNLYVTGRGKGTAVLNHTNNAQTDRTFVYGIIG